MNGTKVGEVQAWADLILGLGLCAVAAIERAMHTLRGWNLELRACGRAHEWAKSLVLLHSLRPWRLKGDLISFSSCLSACEKASRWLKALGILDDMMGSVQANMIAWNAGISAVSKDFQWNSSLELLDRALRSDLEVDLISYASLLSTNRWPLAIQLLNGLEFGSIRSDVKLYNSLLSSCEWPQALEVFQNLDGLVPDVISFSSMMDTEWWRAIQWLEEMSYWSLQANLITYSAVLLACDRSKQWREALMILSHVAMLRLKVDLILYNSALWQDLGHVFVLPSSV